MANANKVHFGLTNVYYAVMTESANAAPTFGTPKRIPGGVSLDIQANTAANNFDADNQTYFRSSKNNGYTGTLTMAKLTDEFKKDCLGYGYDSTNKVLFEQADAAPVPFALLFQIDGDQNDELYVYYRCYANRPNGGGNTMGENGAEPQTEACDITILPVIDPTGGVMNEKVYAATDENTITSVRTAWFSTVFTSFSTT